MDHKKHAALLIIDVQRDFCPAGALEVKNGGEVVPVINSISDGFTVAVATQDWHPKDHFSFASNHPGKKPLDTVKRGNIDQVLWPDHCVAGTEGANFHPDLKTDCLSLILRKGTDPDLDSYSGFFENDRKTSTGLEYYLKGLGYGDVYLCGLATDYCVFYTAMDALRLGFNTYLIEDACRGVDFPEGNVEKALASMRERGVTLLSSRDLRL
jgi:nicotinamidase/pyrazinamidase